MLNLSLPDTKKGKISILEADFQYGMKKDGSSL